MIISKKTETKPYPDLFYQERSVTKRISELLKPEYHNCTLDKLIELAIEIVSMEDTHVSENAKKKYILNFKNQTTKIGLQQYITNIIFKGSNLML